MRKLFVFLAGLMGTSDHTWTGNACLAFLGGVFCVTAYTPDGQVAVKWGRGPIVRAYEIAEQFGDEAFGQWVARSTDENLLTFEASLEELREDVRRAPQLVADVDRYQLVISGEMLARGLQEDMRVAI